MEKELEGVGLTPFDPYHNSSFVVAGKSKQINQPHMFSFEIGDSFVVAK